MEKAVSLRVLFAEAAATFSTQIKNFSLSRSKNPYAFDAIIERERVGVRAIRNQSR